MSELDQNKRKWVVLGEIVAHFGIKGWVKIHSYTRPTEQIFTYSDWALVSLNDLPDENSVNQPSANCKVEVTNYKSQGKGLVAKLAGFDTREMSQSLLGMKIAIDPTALQTLPDGEYYWRDLLGMEVINNAGLCFGRVSDFLETGANDVLVVSEGEGSAEKKQEVLIPWIDEVIVQVNRDDKRILVDWDEDYI